jgi:hypothetical protein
MHGTMQSGLMLYRQRGMGKSQPQSNNQHDCAHPNTLINILLFPDHHSMWTLSET